MVPNAANYELNEAGYIKGAVTVCTPSLPSRHEMLVECMESVRNQTYPAYEHRISLDYARTGLPAAVLNRIVEGVRTEWVAPLADDDLLYPYHLEKLIEVSEGADMIYPWCRVTGTRVWNPNSYFDERKLRRGNYIPATVLIKTQMVHEFGGYDDGQVCEDHAMWIRMLDAGKVIKCLPYATWEYRFHSRNVSSGEILPWEV